MSIKAIVLIVLLLTMISSIQKNRIKRLPEKKVPGDAGHFDAHTPQKIPDAGKDLEKRAQNAVLINKWISQMNAVKTRPTISEWSYKDSSSDTIIFSFTDGIKREGQVSFIYDPAFPRVSQMVYTTETGELKKVRGFLQSGFTENMLCENFRKEKKADEKLSYLNSIAYKAMEEGAADLNILTYQQISEEEFQRMFGEKELNAFIKMLSDEFEEVSMTAEKHILRVRPHTSPI